VRLKSRILVLFGNVPLLGNERANIETLDQLRRRGAEVLFLIRRDWTADSIQKELTRRHLPYLFVPFFDTVRYGQGFRVWLRNLAGIIGGSWALLLQIKSFRATHLHIGSSIWILNFLPTLLFTRLPLIFRAGEVPVRHHALWRWIWKFTCKRVAVFVCDSNFVKSQIVALGVSPDRCEVIYAPPPARQTAAVRATKRNPKGLLTVLYVGQIAAHKGVDLLVEVALRLVPVCPIRFIIAGDYTWQNAMGQAFVRNVKERGLQKKIVFTGFVDDIEPLYALADVHIAPSVFEEPYGITVVEAKAHGLPSIVFPSGGLVELVEHGRDGWICADRSTKSLEDALRYYLESPKSLGDQGSAAFNSLNVRLHVNEYGDRWANVYTRYCR
jgi:glycosyltransferase involved in cell wall biosynthesis